MELWKPFGKRNEGGSNEGDGKKLEDEKKAQDEFIEKIGVSVEAKLAPLRETVNKMQEDWNKLAEAAGKEGSGEGGNGSGEGGSGGTELTDEQKRQVHDRKVITAVVATNARITESEVLSEVREKFPEFETKIKELLTNTDINRKALPDYPVYCRNVVKMVVGEAALNGGLQYDAASKKFFLEDAGGKGDGESYDFLAGDMNWQDPRSGKIVSGREQLAKLGIKPEEFAESQKKGVV